jgi:hypothetical protein
MERKRRDRISRDCKRLIRESKELIKRSREIFDSDGANEVSCGFGKTRRKSKAASASSRDPLGSDSLAKIHSDFTHG